MNKNKTRQTGMAFRVIASVVGMLLFFSWGVSAIGYVRFTKSLTAEYNDSAFRTAQTAAAFIQPDHIQEYLATGGDSDEYRTTLEYMDLLCQRQNVTLLYVIAVDTSDYGRFTAVFDAENDSSDYSHWDIGYTRETTNDEYRQVYRDIYENGLERGTVIRTRQLNGSEEHITSLIPLVGSDGEVKAILCVQRPMSELSEGRRSYARWVAAAMLVTSLLVALAVGADIRKQVVKPICTISEEAARFAGENSKGDENVLDQISQIREICSLATSIDQMESDTLQYIDSLTKATAEKERIGAELDIASKIQLGMLPSTFPPFPDRSEFDIFASMDPAKEVGGDFYDFFLVDDDHLAIVIADVSGKGVPAALFMMASKILINNVTLMDMTSPARILERVNGNICKNNKAEMFVTVWLGILEISTGRLKAANAGHEYPAIRRANGDYELYQDKHGFVVGGMEGIRYKDYEMTLGSGDTLFLYTDGVPEAINNRGEMFGTERMLDAMNGCPDANPVQVLGAVRTAVRGFVKDAPQFDDLTMLCIQMR